MNTLFDYTFYECYKGVSRYFKPRMNFSGYCYEQYYRNKKK